jgi:hypothetical protein
VADRKDVIREWHGSSDWHEPSGGRSECLVTSWQSSRVATNGRSSAVASLISAVTFVLLAVCASVSVSHAANGLRSPTVGTAEVEKSSLRVVTDVSSLRISCLVPTSPAPGMSPVESCQSHITVSAMTRLESGCSTKVLSFGPTATACPGALTAHVTAVHSRWLDAGASKSGTTPRFLLGGDAKTPSRHYAFEPRTPTNGTPVP